MRTKGAPSVKIDFQKLMDSVSHVLGYAGTGGGGGGGNSGGGGSENRIFREGDFVFGKNKAHQWWPGQVFNPGNATEEALEERQNDRILVAFFGDNGSFSWCLPSELMPFLENLDQMLTGTSSESFFDAVQVVLDEIGRVLESKITCKCIPFEKRAHLNRPMVNNLGIRAWILVPEIDIVTIPVEEFRPAKMVGRLTDLARGGSVGRWIDLVVLRSRLSAYTHAEFGQELAVYREFSIEGLERETDVREEKVGSNSAKKYSYRAVRKSVGLGVEMRRRRKKNKEIPTSAANELLQKLGFAATLDDLHLRRDGFLDSVSALVSAYKSSTYVNELDYEAYLQSLSSESSSMSVDETGSSVFSLDPLETSFTPTRQTGPHQSSFEPFGIGTSSKHTAGPSGFSLDPLETSFTPTRQTGPHQSSFEPFGIGTSSKHTASPSGFSLDPLETSFTPTRQTGPHQSSFEPFGFGTSSKHPASPSGFCLDPLDTSSTPTRGTGPHQSSFEPFGIGTSFKHPSTEIPPLSSVKTLKIGTSSTNPGNDVATPAKKLMGKLELATLLLQRFGPRFSSEERLYVELELEGLMKNVVNICETIRNFAEGS